MHLVQCMFEELEVDVQADMPRGMEKHAEMRIKLGEHMAPLGDRMSKIARAVSVVSET